MIRLRFLVPLLLFGLCGDAFPDGVLDLQQLAGDSDLILIGRVISVADGAASTQSTPAISYAGRNETASLQIVRVLKGQVTGQTLVINYLQSVLQQVKPLSQDQVGIFFLSTLTSTSWTLTNFLFPSLPALAQAPANAGGVEAELSQVVASGQASVDDRVRAFRALQQYSTSVTITALKSAASAGDRDLYWCATIALLQKGDADTLTNALAVLNAAFAASDQPYLTTVARAIQGEAVNERAWPALAKLLSSANPEIREGATAAIASAQTSISLSMLPPLLSDSDSLVQYSAVLGLGITLHQPDKTPIVTEFLANSNNYLSYWKGRLPITAMPAPYITEGGIVPVFSPVNVVQSGSWVSIFGSSLASSTSIWNSDFPLNLGNTSVAVNGKAAYLWYVSPTQINLQMPDDTTTGTVEVQVTTSGGIATSTVILGQFSPSLSLIDATHVAGIIVRSDGTGSYGGGTYDILGPTGHSLGYATVAAKAGDVLALFGVGFGPTAPAVRPGQIYSGSAKTTNPVSIVINGTPVVPTFAGITSAGLYQINLVVPTGIGVGEASLLATVGGVQTQSGIVLSLQ